MTDIRALIDTFTPHQKEAVLEVLDALTRPLSVRQIEVGLIARGVPRSRAVIMASSVKDLHIVAMIGGEHG